MRYKAGETRGICAIILSSPSSQSPRRRILPLITRCKTIADSLTYPPPLNARMHYESFVIQRPSMSGIVSKTHLILYSEMKVASLSRTPSSTTSVSPIFSLKVTLVFLGMYYRDVLARFRQSSARSSSYLVDVRLRASSTGHYLLHEPWDFGHDIDSVKAVLKVSLQHRFHRLAIFSHSSPLKPGRLRLGP